MPFPPKFPIHNKKQTFLYQTSPAFSSLFQFVTLLIFVVGDLVLRQTVCLALVLFLIIFQIISSAVFLVL